MAYAEWAGKRLPTEAEWEKAVRGGLEGHKYSWGDTEPNGTQCNFADKNTNNTWSNMNADDGYKYTAPVGSYPANEYGLYDMTGNVWEWCLDDFVYQINYNALRRNPIGGHKSITDLIEHHNDLGLKSVMRDGSRDVDPDDRLTERVLRGGGWDNGGRSLRVYFRSNLPPVNTESYLGFRCVKEIVS